MLRAMLLHTHTHVALVLLKANVQQVEGAPEPTSPSRTATDEVCYGPDVRHLAHAVGGELEEFYHLSPYHLPPYQVRAYSNRLSPPHISAPHLHPTGGCGCGSVRAGAGARS